MPAAVAVPLIVGAASAGAAVYGSRRAGQSQDLATRAQTTAANRAAELEAESQRQSLAFLREQEAQRMKEYEQAQLRNRQIYDDERGLEMSRYSDLQSRLAPYRNFGIGALGQLGSPIPGSLGARMGGQ